MSMSAVITRDLSPGEQSILLYLETCAVDAGGLAEGVRMNSDDFDAIAVLTAEGFLDFGRIYSKLLNPPGFTSKPTHWVELTPLGWAAAAACRQSRALRRGPYAQQVFEARG